MPSSLTYPGVYIEEIPSGIRTIAGIATSTTAFIGRALCGPVSEPTVVNNFGDFERAFGGLNEKYPMSYAVKDFFLNGGGQAIVVRLFWIKKVENKPEVDGKAKLALELEPESKNG